ncbi:MAG: putative ABC transport system permease protein [Cyclobacteriaceae bacterium]|jgi:ABC-type antimicrobial peptide transport system permease subunit
MPYYFKIFLRNFFRHRTSSLINVIGLTTGLSCAFFIYLWVQDEFQVNKFHDNDERLFSVMEFQTYTNETFVTNSTPGILAEGLNKDFPEIQYAVTTTWINKSLLSHDNTFFKEEGFFVSEDFFNIFTYPLLVGDANQVLTDKKSICISRKVAERFFGSVEAATNKQLRYNDDREFLVTGVFEDITAKSTYQFDFVLPFEDFKDSNGWVTFWGNNGPSTFVLLRENVDANIVSSKISDYVKTKYEESNVDLFLKRYSEQYLYGKFTNGKPDGGRIDYVRLFTIIAIFILIIACINFMNLSTARASKRAHEIGVKKALGADRRQLIKQFIGEALFISFLSMLLAFTIVGLLLPQFNIITDKSIEFLLTADLLLMSIGTVLFTGILAGSYPALYLTKFNPVAVLKGDIKSSVGEIWARKGLVIFQFTITIILLIGVFVIYEQMQYAFNKNLGYDKENVVFFSQDGSIQNNREAFFNEIRRIPGVVQAAGISHSMTSQISNTSGLEWRDKSPESNLLFENIRVDQEFQKTMVLELVTGRWFSKDYGSDSTKIVLNEAAIKVMGFTPEKAIGENIQLWEEYDLEIIGVIKDFHYQSIHSTVDPAMFRLDETEHVAVRLEKGNQMSTMKAIKELYESFSPGFIFEYEFLDQSYQELYSSEKRVGTLSAYFAGFAILISCLGLFGLAAFTAERRLKEIGIRKVLGASTTQIVLMLSNDFTKLVLLSIVLALPISYYFMNQWLDNFAYKIDLSIWIFVSAAMLSLAIAWLTVGYQAIKAANVNPAKCLKDE